MLKTRSISFFMLFIFSMLIVKSAFVSASDRQDCHEFAHIHKFHGEKNSVTNISSHGENNKGNNSDSCHAGNILSGVFTFTQQEFICETLVTDTTTFKTVFNDSFYLSPFLDLPKQPPKKSS